MMAAQIKSCESNAANGQLFGTGMQGWHVLGHSVILQHVQQGCLSSIVQTKEQQFAGLLPQAQVDQSIAEPVPEKHFGSVIC